MRYKTTFAPNEREVMLTPHRDLPNPSSIKTFEYFNPLRLPGSGWTALFRMFNVEFVSLQ